MDMSKHSKLAKLEAMIAEQDAEHERKLAEHEAKVAKITGGRTIADYIEEMMRSSETNGLDETDADRLELLDRVATRMPELDLSRHEVEWMRLPDGHEALLVDGGGFDGGAHGVTFANVPGSDDVHAFGPIRAIGSMLIKPDGSRVITELRSDPAATTDE
jgi:hypothetical protein